MDSYEFECSDEMDIECENEDCGKEFEVERNWEPSYSASEINYFECDVCGEKNRDSDMFRQGGKYLCRTCYFKHEIEKLK
ncbi:hypothetical protein [Clostridium perfringens]|uniref:hypothetical protein n=1 Tax=Clostridium perfringens TaxID=1502 RepID=UPI00232D9770|nr:hypothetical protein [Clostridium perfringens]MDB2050197.1 hypothetical protein [Clostridium perfringens]